MVIHGDGDVLDVLTRWLEANGFDVLTAINAFRAQGVLEGDRPVGVVIAPWDVTRPVGGEVYRWVLQHRPSLRSRFVFVADEVPPEFDAVVGGRCLALPLSSLDEIVRVAAAVVRRTRTPSQGLPIGGGRASLLLVDDDSFLLEVMAELLHSAGYAVTQVDSIRSAIELLDLRDFDAMVVDWRTHDGCGADLYEWVLTNKAELANRVVFLAENDLDDSAQAAPGRPMFRKGQDSRALTDVLSEIVKRVTP
jgi:CheY-like chemotaxis protein